MRVIGSKRRFKMMITAIKKYQRCPWLSERETIVLAARLDQYKDLLDYAYNGMPDLPSNKIIQVD